jgi:hypothetical protein
MNGGLRRIEADRREWRGEEDGGSVGEKRKTEKVRMMDERWMKGQIALRGCFLGKQPSTDGKEEGATRGAYTVQWPVSSITSNPDPSAKTTPAPTLVHSDRSLCLYFFIYHVLMHFGVALLCPLLCWG